MYSVFRKNIRTSLIKIVLIIRRITAIRDSGTSGKRPPLTTQPTRRRRRCCEHNLVREQDTMTDTSILCE